MNTRQDEIQGMQNKLWTFGQLPNRVLSSRTPAQGADAEEIADIESSEALQTLEILEIYGRCTSDI
jgi:hypothetical protein